MTGARVVLRCDAGPEIGAGHLIRSLALAEALRRCGAEPCLVTGELPYVWRHLLARRGLAALEHPALRPDSAGDDLLPGQAELAVLDGYELDSACVAAWRRRAAYLAVIDDGDGDRGADAVVNSCLSARAEAYPHTRLRLLGPDYALLREEFVEPPERRPPDAVPRLLVSLGGSTAAGLAERLLCGLEATGRALHARWIASPHEDPLAPAPRENGSVEVEIAPPLPTLLDEMLEADLGLFAAGGVRFEAARVGLPMVLGILADNQVADARAFADAGAAHLLGWWREVEPADIGEVVRGLLDDTEARNRLATRAGALVDGHGAERAARALLTAAAEGTGK